MWKDVHDRSFEKLKTDLCAIPVLRLPDFSKPFVVGLDASYQPVGAVLF